MRPHRATCRVVLALMALGLIALLGGCGEAQPEPIDPQKYLEAKKRNDSNRAREYGRKSITDAKASGLTADGQRIRPR